MRMNCLVLSLSLMCLVLSSFHEVSCQDDGTSGLSTLDLIDRDYQDSVNALQRKIDEDTDSAKIQSDNKKNTTLTDKNTISLSLSDESDGTFSDSVDNSTQSGAVKRSALLDQIEHEFEAHLNGLNEAGSDSAKTKSKDVKDISAQRQKILEDMERDFEAASSSLKRLKIDELSEGNDEEQSAYRKSLLEEIEREFEAATKDLEQLKVNDFTGDKAYENFSAKRKSMLEAIEHEFEAAIEELKVSDSTRSKDKEQIAKRQSMLEEIEREFEAATSSLQQLHGLTEGNADDEQSAKRKSMLEEMEREFEAATKGLEQLKVNEFTEGSANEEQSAKRKSMLEEIEREFEAAVEGHKQIKVDDSRNSEEQSAKRKIMLEEIEREFEEALSGFSAKANKEESFSIKEIISEESAIQETETSSNLTKSLNQLVENHRKENESSNAHRVLTSSSSSTSESAATSETVESLRAKLKEFRGLTARQLVTRQDFEEILVMATSLVKLNSAPTSYISRLARYRNVIKEGLEASERVHIANARAKLLKEAAAEKQAFVDANFAEAKTLAQRRDALYVRILAIKKLLKKLEAERESVDGKYKEIVNNLSHLLVEASEAYEEYHGALRKAKDEEAAEEIAREATESAEIIWVKFLSSL